MNIIFLGEFIFLIITIFFTIFMIVWLIGSYKKQKMMIKGLRYRKQNALFTIKQYTTCSKTPTVSLLQENDGIDPNTFTANLKYVNYFSFIFDDSNIERNNYE